MHSSSELHVPIVMLLLEPGAVVVDFDEKLVGPYDVVIDVGEELEV